MQFPVLACAAGGALVAALAGCGEFETRSIVLDLRLLSLTTEPPELVAPIGQDDLLEASPQELLNLAFEDVEVCALVSDPSDTRSLHYRMRACMTTESLRCDDPDRLVVDVSGTDDDPTVVAMDPEMSADPVRLCQTLSSDAVLTALILDLLSADDTGTALATEILAGGGTFAVQIEFSVRGEDQPQEAAVYGLKRMRYSLMIPDGRVANTNPSIATLDPGVNDSDAAPSMPNGRCGDIDPLVVAPGDVVNFMPIEPDGVREDYLVLTFDGDTRMFTENLTYAWYATHGSWEPEITGGPTDFAGNPAELDSDWTAPREQVGDGLDVRVFVVQTDERGGQSWFESCVRVAP